MLSRCFHCARLESMYWNSVSTFGALLQFQYHSCEEIVYFSRDFSTTFIQYIHIPKSHRGNRCYSDAFIVQDLNRCTEIQYTLLGHFVPQLWRNSLIFIGCSNYFHSIHQTYRSHIGATGVIAMLSLCRTGIEVLKFSLHLWGTSSVSVPQLWRDSLLFKGL